MSNSIKAWKIIEEHVYETFKIFRLRRSRRLNPRTGDPFDFFLMDGLDWANIIALTPAQEVVLVRQYRHGAEATTIEIPGGCVERDESPQASALRELEEETGYRADGIQELGVIHPNPAMQAMRCHCFIAYNAVPACPPKLDPGEDIRTTCVPLSKVRELIISGEITHAIVLAALALFFTRFPPPQRA